MSLDYINNYPPETPWILNTDGERVLKVDPDGSMRVRNQNRFTPALILPMLLPLQSTTTTAPVIKDSYTCQILDATGINIGDLFRLIDPINNRFYQGTVLNLVGTTVTTDAPFDFAYPTGVEFATGRINMNVNGSVTPQIFKLRIGSTSVPGVADITRMVFMCETNGAVDLNRFGDITGGLTRGIMFRSTNGIGQNIFTIRTNGGLSGIAYDFQPYQASNPSQGINGFACRLTFAGESKFGVVLRVEQNDNLELWVQDNLTSIVSLRVILEGHIVD